MMRYFKLGTAVLFSALLMIAFPAFGQNSADSLNQKHVENVTVYGTSKPIIQKAYKINQKPQLPSMNLSTSGTFKDDFTGIEMPTSITLQPIKPKLINEEIKGTAWNNIVRAGLGSRISPYAEFFHSSGKESSYRFNVHLYHYSSYKNIKNYLPSPYSNTLAEADFEKYFNYHVLGFKASYNLNTNRYYGHNTSNDTITYDKNSSEFKQRYQEGAFSIDYASTYRNFDKLHHDIHAKSYYMSDIRGLKEFLVSANFDVHKSFEVYNLFNHQQLGLEGKCTYYQLDTRSIKIWDKLINAVPYFDAKYGIISFRAGANIQWLKSYNLGWGNNYTVKLHLYPMLKVNVNVIPQRLSIFAGVNGGLKKNTLKSLTESNPFLSSYNNQYVWQNTKIRFYGGIKGNIAQKLNFDFHAGYQTFQNMAFFDYPVYVSSGGSSQYLDQGYYLNTFQIRYGSGNLTSFSAGFSYVNSSSVKLWLLGNYNHYEMDNNYYPLYKPLKEIRFGCSVKMSGKFRPWVEAYYVGSRWASRHILSLGSSYSDYYQLPAYYDINFGSDYQINTQLSAFLKFTNLLNLKYMQFNGYPVPGLEVMVGASYKF